MKLVGIQKKRLTRTDWLDAAIETLSSEGVGAIFIVQLADRLGVTRGSFYHHFSDREDLLRAMLEYWEEAWTTSIRDEVRVLEVSPIEKLIALVRLVRSKNAAGVDAPFRAWALHDPLAREYLERVDGKRLGYIRSLFEAAGFETVDIENRARLLLFYEMSDPAFFADRDLSMESQLCEQRLRMLLNLPEDIVLSDLC